jgi:TusA-related sulfurtransferase
MAADTPNEVTTIDLSGIPCPLNWARAKARLEGMGRGERLLIVVDDPRAERDIPAAAECEGWAVISVRRQGSRILIVLER